MNIIETHELTKIYGNFTAVSHLNLHIRKGSVYGFLGPNGAGKSTTMKMFLGLTRPTEGYFIRQIAWKSCAAPVPSSNRRLTTAT